MDQKTILIIALTVVISTVVGHFLERELEKRWPSQA